MRAVLAGVVVVLAGLAVPMLRAGQAAPPSTQAPPAPPADADAIGRGRKVFLNNCPACHGQDATGGSDANTDLTRSVVVHNDIGGKQFGAFLADGRPELRMPPFVLEPEDVKDLAAYLRSISVLTRSRGGGGASSLRGEYARIPAS